MTDFVNLCDFNKYSNDFTVNRVHNKHLYAVNECSSSEDVSWRVNCTVRLLKCWKDLKGNQSQKLKYIDILNAFLHYSQENIKVQTDCSRLEGRLRRLCSRGTGETQRKIWRSLSTSCKFGQKL